MIAIDIAKSGFQNVIDLIKANNGGESFTRVLDNTNVTLAAPTEIVGEDEFDNNTQVVLSAIQDKGYSGTRTLTYFRPTLEQVSAVPASTIQVDTTGHDTDKPAYEARVKAAIALALELRAEDFELAEEAPVPETENTPVQINIRPVEGSFLYSGSLFEVSFTNVDNDVPLESFITVTDMEGFDF